MKFYVSQLVETEKILPILRKYDVGLEVVQFANPYILDNRDKFINEYKDELKEMYNKVDLIIHGPYADLPPGSRDSEIRRISKMRMEQAYEVSNKLKAKKILYHNGYTPNTYTYVEWKHNAYNYWDEFMKGKDDSTVVIENVLDEDYELIDDLMKKINKNNFSVCLDIGHVNTYSKISVEKWIDALSYKIDHIHLHNNFKDRDSHNGIDKGSMDVISILKKLNDVNENITVSLEVVDFEELKSSLDILVKEKFINLR